MIIININEKKDKYRKLCLEVADRYRILESQNEMKVKNKDKDVYMRWFDYCNEINLWTYWQGINVFNPKIMVLGQDWASPFADEATVKYRINAVEENLEINDACHYFDIPSGELTYKDYETDFNLTYLFNLLGYDDIMKKRYEDLFFSNVCLGYRSRGATGNYKMSWITEIEKDAYKRLITILEPKVIICIGKYTYKSLLKIFGINDPRIKNKFNDFLDTYMADKDGPKCVDGIPVLVSSHCGSLGTINRGEKKQVEDWEAINEYIQNNIQY